MGESEGSAMNPALNEGILMLLEAIVLKLSESSKSDGSVGTEAAADKSTQGLAKLIRGSTQLIGRWSPRSTNYKTVVLDDCRKVMDEIVTISQEMYSKVNLIFSCRSSLSRLKQELKNSPKRHLDEADRKALEPSEIRLNTARSDFEETSNALQ